MPIQNTIECVSTGNLAVLEANLLVSTKNQAFSTIDNDFGLLTSTKRTAGTGFTVAKTTSSNSSRSVASQLFPLLFTANAVANQTLGYSPISLNLSENFFVYIEDGFMVFPLLFTGAAGNSALTQAQRTVQVAVRTNDTTPKVYGGVATAVGALTPAIIDTRLTAIIGDSSNTGAMNLQNTQQKLKIPLEVLNDGNGVAANVSITKIIDNIQILFALPVGASFEYYKPEAYATYELYCPEPRRIQITNLSDFKMELKASFDNVDDYKKSIVDRIGRQRADSVNITSEGLDMKTVGILSGSIAKIGGLKKANYITGTLSSLTLVDQSIDSVTTVNDIFVTLTDPTGKITQATVITGANPLANQVLLVIGATNKLVFNSTNAGSSYSIRTVAKDSSRQSMSINESIVVKADLEVILGNSDTVASSTDYKTIRSTGQAFFADVNFDIMNRDKAQIAKTNITLTRAKGGDLQFEF
jgi:hypothetical protein